MMMIGNITNEISSLFDECDTYVEAAKVYAKVLSILDTNFDETIEDLANQNKK